MKIVDIRKMDDAQIQESLLEARNEYMNLRFQAVSGQLTDTSKLKQARRDIAQLETVLREKELGLNVEGKK